MKKTLAIVLVTVFVLSLSAAALAFTPTSMHETIDGFDSFFTTGNVEVEAVPMLYNVRNGNLTVNVRVKAGVAGDYKRNTLTVYQYDAGEAYVHDMLVSTTSTEMLTRSPAQMGYAGTVTHRPDFVFNITSIGSELTYQAVLEEANELEVSFVLSTYISIDNDLLP